MAPDPIAGVHHVSINVDDVAAANRFYTEVLGFEIMPRPDFDFPGTWLRAGVNEVHLLGAPAVPDDIGQHVAFRVADVDEWVLSVRAAGVEITDPRTLPTGTRQVFLHDPSGNRIELTEPVA